MKADNGNLFQRRTTRTAPQRTAKEVVAASLLLRYVWQSDTCFSFKLSKKKKNICRNLSQMNESGIG